MLPESGIWGCVRASVVDAMQAGFRPLVVADCVGGRALGPHEAKQVRQGAEVGSQAVAETQALR